MNLYKQMDRKTAKVGAIKVFEYIRAQHVYTGWIRTMDEEPKWLYCNRRGKMIFERFATEEEAQLYINNDVVTANSEEVSASAPVSGDMRKVYPSDGIIDSLEVVDLDAPEVFSAPTIVQYVDDAAVYPAYPPPLSTAEENV